MSFYVIAWRAGHRTGYDTADSRFYSSRRTERIIREVETLSAAEHIAERLRRGLDRAEEIASGEAEERPC